MTRTKTEVVDLLKNIVIAEIKSVEKHQDADRLYITFIDAGDAQVSEDIKNENGLIQIVTAADNFKVGDKVPYLSPGHVVPGWLFKEGEEIRLESRKMRGEISHGMILAEDEIGIGEDHEGILIIDEKNSKIQIRKNKDQPVTLDLIQGMVGEPLVDLLSDEALSYVMNLAGVVEMTTEMQEKYDLILRDLQESVGEEEIPSIIKDRPLKVYWGTAPTGRPSVGYFVPMIKISDFLKAGCEVTILLANIHAFLDNMKSSWEVLEHRTRYYKMLITEMLSVLGTPLENLRFIEGKDFQLGDDYTMDMYKIATMTTTSSVKGAGAEVVKQVESPLLGGLLYPILQALDEQYLEVDAQLGGLDQRKIFMFARESLPKIGYKKRIHFMNPLIPGLGKSGKMSSSEPNSKIDFDETNDEIREKINKAYSVDGEVEGNGLLALLKYIIFRKLEVEERGLLVKRPEKWGGDIEYANYEAVEENFINKDLSSVDLKPAIAEELINLVKPIRDKILQEKKLVELSYPESN